MAYKHPLEWVLPTVLEQLRVDRSILMVTEGVGYDILLPLEELIEKLELLGLEEKGRVLSAREAK